MSRAARKARGVFYTPRWLACEIIETALKTARRAQVRQRLTVVDPACGDGAFTRLLPQDVDVFGVDADATSLAVAAAGGGTFVHGDAIVDDDNAGAVAPPLRWHQTFPAVFAQGGFDVVIGNPPFRNIDQAQSGDDPEQFAAFKTWVRTFRSDDPARLSWADHYRRMADLYHLFIARGLWALRPGGVLAFVTSRTWLDAWYADKLRARLASETTLVRVVDYSQDALFEGTQIPVAVVVLIKTPPPDGHRVDVRVGDTHKSVAQSDLGAGPWRFLAATTDGVRLGALCDLSQGMQTGANAVFAGLTAADVREHGIEPAHVHRRAVGSDIHKGRLADRRVHHAIWTEDLSADALPPGVHRWLTRHRKTLEARAAFKRGDCQWHRWSWPRPTQFGRPKILCPYRARENRFWFDAAGDTLGLPDTTVLIPKPDCPLSPDRLVALLNDDEHTARHLAMAKRTGQGLVEYFARPLSDLPITF